MAIDVDWDDMEPIAVDMIREVFGPGVEEVCIDIAHERAINAMPPAIRPKKVKAKDAEGGLW